MIFHGNSGPMLICALLLHMALAIAKIYKLKNDFG
jgi:hypothetical protein